MKKIILATLTFGLLINSFAQTEKKKLPAFAIHFFFNDFKTAEQLRTTGIVDVFRTKSWKRTNQMNPGLALSYINGISDHVDFIGTLSGSFVDYPIPGKDNASNSKFLLEAAVAANLKLLSDNYFISPYISVGAGVSKWSGYYGAFIPAGLGLQVKLFDEASLLINSQYRMRVTENVAYHFYHSIGFAGNLSKRKVVEAAPLPAPPATVE
jgi:OmpA-OmpF porin, OOP family